MSKPLAHMTDSELLNWAKAALALIAPSFADWGISQATLDDFGEFVGGYDAAYSACKSENTRGVVTCFEKSQSRDRLVEFSQKMIRQIQGAPQVTDTMRTRLGISVRKDPEPIPSPTTSPVLAIEDAVARKLGVRTNGPKGGRVKRPAGVRGVALFTAVGNSPPAVGSPDWIFRGNTSEKLVEVDFPTNLPNGTIVWLCGFYIGSRMESDPISPAISAILPGDLSQPETTLKMAA